MTTADGPDLAALGHEETGRHTEGLSRPAEGWPETEPPRRRFRAVGVFDGERDLGRCSKRLTRHELGRGSTA
ncbi:hypothetical protein ACXIZN_34535 [Amycolatopsis sp. TRM77291]